MSTLKLALIGCGRIAQVGHLGALTRLRGAKLVALADADPGRLQQAARRVPGAILFQDYRELLNRSGADAVVLALPTGVHADAAIAAFEAAKHVYVEKPLAADLDEARRILAAQARSSRLGMIGFNLRFHALYRALHREILNGRIGRVIGARTVLCSATRQLPEWKTNRRTGGSALLDLASHHIDLARFVFDQDIRDVSAESRSLRTEEDNAAMQFRLMDGTPVHTLVSMTSAEDDRFEIFGEAGKLTVDRFRGHAVEFTPARRARTGVERVRQALALTLGMPKQVLHTLRAPEEHSYLVALQAFVDAVLGGGVSPISLDEGFESLAVIAAAEESGRTGRRESVTHLRPVAAAAPVMPPDPVQTTTDATGPAMSVVVVSSGHFKTIRRTVRFLRAQTVRQKVELILVGPTVDALNDREPYETEGFYSVKSVAAGPIANVDKAAAHGVYRATAPVVALVEDHAYPAPDWAEALIEAHQGPWTAVGSIVLNANPDTAISWTNLLLAYGAWVPPVQRGETRSVSRHNISFKRAALAVYHTKLEDYMGRDGGLLQRMLGRGDRFYLEPAAKIYHANFSLLRPTLALRFRGGRISAATRASLEGWSILRRLLYVGGSPLFPLLRARPLFRKVLPRMYPSFLLGLILDGMGQAVGFLVGAGDTATTLADFEVDRLRHVTAADRQMLQE